MKENTIELLNRFQFKDDTDTLIKWADGQLEIIDCIVNRESPDGKKRVETIAATQYGKSLAVGAGLAIRASTFPEKWSIVAGTKEKARIIMEYVTMFSLDTPVIRTQLDIETPLDRLRMKKSQDRLTYKKRGEVRVFSADARRIADTSKSLMGFGAPNVVEDESALIPDILQATVMRMLGGHKDNFLMKIGNPFHRNHFLRTWRSDRYYKILIDYRRALKEGRFSQDFIDEMREEALFDVLYECKFPEEGAIDAKGWLSLLTDTDIEKAFVEQEVPFGEERLGCDIAGGGRNFSVMVARAYNMARKVYKENEPDTMKFAGSVIRTAKDLGIKDKDIFVDKIGIGRGAYDRLNEMKNRVIGVGGSDSPSDKGKFVNLRAEIYWRAREWILHGGKLKKDNDFYQLSQMKYKVADSSGKIKMMSKQEMLQLGIDSPDVADALSTTFARADIPPAYQEQPSVVENDPREIEADPYD